MRFLPLLSSAALLSAVAAHSDPAHSALERHRRHHERALSVSASLEAVADVDAQVATAAHVKLCAQDRLPAVCALARKFCKKHPHVKVCDLIAEPTTTATSSTAQTTTMVTSTTKASGSSTSAEGSYSTSAASSSTQKSSASSSSASTTSASVSTSVSSSSSTSTASGTCAPTYSAKSMITGTGTLPKPTSFVKKEKGGQRLLLDGENFRMVGPNMYWLCEDENVDPVGAWTSKTRIREALAIAVAMGANTVRVFSCGTSVGNKTAYHLEENDGEWQDEAWDVRDYALYAAREYGLRVVITLTSNWDYYHGGKYTFLRWFGISEENKGELFYSNQQAIEAFHEYVEGLLTHKNPYTGKTWAEDPTIVALETGNELGGYINAEMWPPANWTESLIDVIKKHDKNHLIMDGVAGFWNYTSKTYAPSVNYPRNVALVTTEIPIAGNSSKNFVVSEYDWTTNTDKDTLDDFLALLETEEWFGDLAWSVFGHDDQCCNYVEHNDGYSLYYPNGNRNSTGDLDDATQSNILKLVQHWYRVTGRDTPAALPGVACPQPEF
ncbi:hypothetical protein JCM10207_003557 [Rhodosporidiobolus poonsookiae]